MKDEILNKKLTPPELCELIIDSAEFFEDKDEYLQEVALYLSRYLPKYPCYGDGD